MPTDAYLHAANQQNRKPSVLMRVEDAEGVETFYTTKSDWDGSAELKSVYTSSIFGITINVGDIRPAYVQIPIEPQDGGSYDLFGVGSFTYSTYTSFVPLANIDINTLQIGGIMYPASGNTGGSKTTSLQIRSGSPTGTIVATSDTRSLSYSLSFDSNVYFAAGLTSGELAFTFSTPPSLTDGTTYYITPNIVGVTGTQEFGGGDKSTDSSKDPATTTAGGYVFFSGTAADSIRVLTSTIDLGSTPGAPVILSIDDLQPAGSSITYTALGGNEDPPTVDLGTVSDGDSLTAYRYYRLQAAFDIDEPPGLPTISEFILTEGAFLDYGTHKDLPISGVVPHLTPDTVSSLTQKIDLSKGITTTGEMTVKMFWTPEVSDMIATGYLKGKDVSIYAGFVGLDLIDYLPIFVGTWYDHSFDEEKRIITVKCRDILKQFEKRKLPEETYDASGTKTNDIITYDVDNIIETITDLYDAVGIRSRYIPTDYAALQTGIRSGPDWNISRVISKPQEVWKLLDQLAQTAGLWLTPIGNGQIIPKVYDRNESANADYAVGNGIGDFSKISGNLKEFYSRYYVYYNPKSTFQVTPDYTDPSSTEDFNNGTALINATAELNWSPEKGTKEFLDLWKVGRSDTATPLTSPPKALTELNRNRDSWFTEPLFTVKCSKLPPRFAAIEVGDVIPVNGLLLPVSNAPWDNATAYTKGAKVTYTGIQWQARQDSTNEEPMEGSRYWQDTKINDDGLTDDKRFLVIGRTFDPNKAIIDLDLMEMPPLTRGEVTMGGYASIKVADGAIAQTGITSTPVLLTGWTTNGDASGLTPDYTNGKITIDIDGAYRVEYQSSFSGGGGLVIEQHLRVNGVEQDEGCHRKMAAGGDVGSVSVSSILELTAGDIVTVYIQSDGTASITTIDAQLTINQVD